MTRQELENLMNRAGLTQHQIRELEPAIHAYATSQASAAIDCMDQPVWHALTLTPEVGSRCGAVGVNTTNTRLVNCPDCLKGQPA